MSLKAQVAHGLKWKAINLVGSKLLSLMVFTTLARLLDTSAFGLVALVGVYLFFTTLVADQGITIAIIQRQNLKPAHLAAAFWFNLACNIFLALLTIALAGPIAKMFGEPRLAPLLCWASLGMVIDASAAIHSTLFIKEMDFRRPTLRALIANAVGGAVGVGMAFAGCGVWALIGQQISSSFAGAVFLWSASSFRPTAKFGLIHLRELFGVSTSVFATSILWFVSSRIDQVVIGRFAGADILGLYVIGGKLPDLATSIIQQPVSQVSLPALSQLQHDHERLRRVIYSGMKVNALVSFAVFVGLAVVSSDMIPVVFGGKWASATRLCELLSIYALTNAMHIFFYPALLASGGVGKYVLLNVWHTIGVLVACVVGIQFGINWLVVGLIFNNLVVTIPALIYMRSRIGLSAISYCKPCLVPALASLVMAASMWLVGTAVPVETPLSVRLACKVIIGAAAYVGFMLVFQRETVVELWDTLRRALKRHTPAFEAVAPPVVTN